MLCFDHVLIGAGAELFEVLSSKLPGLEKLTIRKAGKLDFSNLNLPKLSYLDCNCVDGLKIGDDFLSRLGQLNEFYLSKNEQIFPTFSTENVLPDIWKQKQQQNRPDLKLYFKKRLVSEEFVERIELQIQRQNNAARFWFDE